MAEARLARPVEDAPPEPRFRLYVTLPRATAERLVLGLALLVFAVHAINYLFFFVDDEGIPFVFARHLLAGKGLVYNSFEGRVEGYSDFLHVLTVTGWLWLARLLGFGRLAPFFMAKAISFACGIATVVVAWGAMRRFNPTRAGLVAGLAFLTTFAPLAIWSCSSLEMAAVALLVTTLMFAIIQDTGWGDWLAAAASCLLVLERIDGFVFVGALLVPALAAASPQRRRELARRVGLPFIVTFAAYHGWRRWYFGDWLTCPLAAKILYKLLRTYDITTRPPHESYLAAFLRAYGLLPGMAAMAVLAMASLRQRRSLALLAGAALVLGYIGVVGDWMAGFRFLLPAAPLVAVLIAVAVSGIAARAVAWTLTASLALWFGGVAVNQARAYDSLEYRDSWWLHPSFDPQLYFGQYLRMYEDLSTIIGPESTSAYNQAGFVPYMLKVENVDDLGICSRFIAHLPTTDVVFTEVGRYSPLTNKTAVRAAHAYILYRNPEFIVEPLDNLRSANGGAIPDAVLRSHYQLLFTDAHAQAAVYRRIAPPGEFQTNPRMFLENLATPSRLVRAYDGADVPQGERLRRLPFLADGVLDRTFSDAANYAVVFSKTDLPVYELDIDGVWARTAVRMLVVLRDGAGREVARDDRTLAAAGSTAVTLGFPGGVRASAMELTFQSVNGRPTRIILHDLRVQGQSPELADYVSQLPFPAAGAVR